MKYPFVRAALALAAAASMTGAVADNKLFPTDTLAPGQLDVMGELGSTEAEWNAWPRTEATTHAASLYLRAGVGARTHIGVALAAFDSEARNAFGSRSSHATGAALNVRHALIADPAFSLAVGGAVTRSHANGSQGSRNVYSANLSAGWTLPSGVRPYVGAGVTVPDEDDAARTTFAIGGIWLPVASRVTLVPEVAYARSTEAGSVPSGTTWGLSLSAMLGLGDRTYLLPTVERSELSDDRGESTGVSIGLYHQF